MNGQERARRYLAVGEGLGDPGGLTSQRHEPCDEGEEEGSIGASAVHGVRSS